MGLVYNKQEVLSFCRFHVMPTVTAKSLTRHDRHGSLSEAKTTCRTMGSRSSTEMGQSRCHHNKKPRQRISGFQAGEPSIGNQLDNSFGSFTYPTHFFGDLLETLNQSCATALEVLPLDVSRAFCRPISSFTARRP